MPERIIVIDLETTGLYPERGDRILEIAAVPVVNERAERENAFQRLVNPGMPIPPEITRINHITDGMVAGAQPLDRVLPEFLAYIADAPLIAHNAPFDIGFLQHYAATLGLGRIGNRVIDTIELSKELFPGEKSHNLDALTRRLGITHSHDKRHRSLEDAELTALCYLAMKKML
jgi:DNA polymerase-3 subunit epsilon